MALVLNGTTSKLVHTGAIGGLITSYPFTMFGWVKQTSPVQNGFPFVIEGTNTDLGIGGSGSAGCLLDTALKARAYQSVGSGIAAFSANTYTAGTWTPVMVVFTSASSRTVYLLNGAGVSDGTTIASGTMSGYKTLAIGCRSLPSDNFMKGEVACVGMWSAALGATEWATLIGGAVPSTVAAGSLIDYWSLQNQAATQTGINGRVLTATNTSQASTHPITEGGTAPGFTTQPANQTVTTPATATFSCVASGTGTLTYQWQRQPSGGGGYVDIAGATASSYTTPATTVTGGSANNGDTYRVVVTGDTSPPATSNAATLTVNSPTGPTINTQPSNQSVTSPATATFTVAATASAGALSYQWQRQPAAGGGYVDIAGATAASYTTPATTVTGGSANNNDTYRVNVTDTNGTVTSSVVTLTVAPAVAGLTSSPMKNNTGTLLTSVPWEAYVNVTTTGALVVKKTGLTSHASTAVITFTDSTLVAGTQYAVRWRRTDTGDEGYERLTAA